MIASDRLNGSAGIPQIEPHAEIAREDPARSLAVALLATIFAPIIPIVALWQGLSHSLLLLALVPVGLAARYGGWAAGFAAVAAGTTATLMTHPVAGRGSEAWFIASPFIFTLVGIAWCATCCRPRRLEESLASPTETEAELRKQSQALQKRAADLSHRADELHHADARKDEALAILAHELRNPLSPISTAANLLRSTTTPAERDRWIRIIEDQVQVLTRLVDDLLDEARIRHGKVKVVMATVDLAEVVASAAESCRSLMGERRHEFFVCVPSDGPLWAEVDADRLRQVVFNLVSNAAKYTDPGGSIWVSLERLPDVAIIRVRDNGIGISTDFLPRVWDQFSQHRTGLDRAGGGIGLGLTLVKKLVELHGGTVMAKSDGLNQGSEFVVTLPRKKLSWGKRKGGAAPEPGRPPRKVLVVEDNLAAAETLAAYLRIEGHNVVVVHDGVAALATADHFHPDAILLDIGLPGMDGFEISRQLRSRGHRSVIVAVTGCAAEEQQAVGRLVGIDHYLLKPVPLAEVRSILAATPELESLSGEIEIQATNSKTKVNVKITPPQTISE
jgi:signal transduction histidine kinase/ActR/RegA family two-component response regulator